MVSNMHSKSCKRAKNITPNRLEITFSSTVMFCLRDFNDFWREMLVQAAVYLVLFVQKGGVGSEIRGPALICLCDTKGHHLFRMGSGCQSPLPLCLVPTEEPRHYGSPRLIVIANSGPLANSMAQLFKTVPCVQSYEIKLAS